MCQREPRVDLKAKQSFLRATDRSIDLMVLENENQNLPLADVIVTLEMGKYPGTDFNETEAIADLGYFGIQGVACKASLLQRFTVDGAT